MADIVPKNLTMIKKKYTLLKQEPNEYGLYQIQSLVDIPKYGIKIGDLGGWVESEDNLSHLGSCWITEKVLVRGHAIVTNDAKIGGSVNISGNAQIYGNSIINGEGKICGNASIRDSKVNVYGTIEGNSFITDAKVEVNGTVTGKSKIYDTMNLGLIYKRTKDVNYNETKTYYLKIYTLNKTVYQEYSGYFITSDKEYHKSKTYYYVDSNGEYVELEDDYFKPEVVYYEKGFKNGIAYYERTVKDIEVNVSGTLTDNAVIRNLSGNVVVNCTGEIGGFSTIENCHCDENESRNIGISIGGTFTENAKICDIYLSADETLSKSISISGIETVVSGYSKIFGIGKGHSISIINSELSDVYITSGTVELGSLTILNSKIYSSPIYRPMIKNINEYFSAMFIIVGGPECDLLISQTEMSALGSFLCTSGWLKLLNCNLINDKSTFGDCRIEESYFKNNRSEVSGHIDNCYIEARDINSSISVSEMSGTTIKGEKINISVSGKTTMGGSSKDSSISSSKIYGNSDINIRNHDILRCEISGDSIIKQNKANLEDCTIHQSNVINNYQKITECNIYNSEISESDALIQNCNLYDNSKIIAKNVAKDITTVNLYNNSSIINSGGICNCNIINNSSIVNANFTEIQDFEWANIRDNSKIYGCCKIQGENAVIEESIVSGNKVSIINALICNNSYISDENLKLGGTISIRSIGEPINYNTTTNTMDNYINYTIISHKTINYECDITYSMYG